jgi:hypothetical protein
LKKSPVLNPGVVDVTVTVWTEVGPEPDVKRVWVEVTVEVVVEVVVVGDISCDRCVVKLLDCWLSEPSK